MRKIPIALAVAGAMGIFTTSAGVAAPVIGAAIMGSVEATSPVQDARLFCYNRYTGRFLHWGSCAPRRVYYRPRVYCKNRYTGRFLYWGACR